MSECYWDDGLARRPTGIIMGYLDKVIGLYTYFNTSFFLFLYVLYTLSRLVSNLDGSAYSMVYNTALFTKDKPLTTYTYRYTMQTKPRDLSAQQ